MSTAWTQMIIVMIFLVIAVVLRVWAARKYIQAREQFKENNSLLQAFNALRTSGDTTFILLIMVLVWIAKQAWPNL